MNKSFVTNFLSALLLIAAYFSPESPYRLPLLNMGLFALSGAFTNWLAVYMLFEKIPGVYGSGVVPLNFEKFKSGIRNLIMDNFFTHENYKNYLEKSLKEQLNSDKLIEQIDFDEIFDEILNAIKESSFGPFIGMVGGDSALEKLREPFTERLKKGVGKILKSPQVHALLQKQMTFETLKEKVEIIIDKKLAELTPQMVKEIVERMIHEHLGWLVVWGGVFGGLIGLVSAFVVS